MTRHPTTDQRQWDLVADLFERLLLSDAPEATAALEPDLDIRREALNLWQHHVSADEEHYLDAPLEFAVASVFQPGQLLADRFRIEKLLGCGGMGEVYLAWDSWVEGHVALKTIARLLVLSPALRKRFTAEVQNARRVTHPNVCRIHEIFEEAETAFFTMEYLEGDLLSDFLGDGKPAMPLPPVDILLPLAQALQAAHDMGVVHGDFKPANVMIARGPFKLRPVVMDFGLARGLDRAIFANISGAEETLSVHAGTTDYMAPELQDGEGPTVRSDIFAFGRVAKQLLPGRRIWEECTRTDPARRPRSLERVIQSLSMNPSRRYWMGGAAVAAGAMALERYWSSRRDLSLNLPVGARILVNGFRTASAELSRARLIRSLLLTGLQQSPRLSAIADNDLLPALRRLKTDSNSLPLTGQTLNGLLTHFRAGFWVDGDLHKAEGKFTLDLRLMDATQTKPLAASVFASASGVVSLAHLAVAWIRKTAGESDQSLAANPPNVSTYTSLVPESLQKYYEALEYYAVAQTGLAIPLLEEAVRLDPAFAQAHDLLGLTLTSARRYDDAYKAINTAMQLSDSRSLPERERGIIRTHFYRATEDIPKTIESARQNLTWHPEDSRSYTVLGQGLVMAGNAPQAVDAFRSALRIAPDEWMNVLQLEDALVEAGEFSQALDEFNVALSRGIASPWIYNGAAAAYMGLERYDEAAAAFAKEPLDASNAADLQGPKIMTGKLSVAIAAMEEQRARAANPVEAHQANHYLSVLYFLTDRPESARRCVGEMAGLPAYPFMARRLSGTVSWARRLGDDKTLTQARAITAEIAGRWPNSLTNAVDWHAAGLDAWRRNSPAEAESLLLNSAGSAFGIWTLFDLAEFYTSQARWDLAEAYWEKFDAHRGTVIVKVWCPAILVLAWFSRAVAAQSRNDRPKAFEYSKKVLDHWAGLNPDLRIVRDARRIHSASLPL